MNMRIITPRGFVREIDKVSPFTEASTFINNRKKYIFEPAEKLQYATGLVLSAASTDFAMRTAFIIGNLKNAKVREIIHTLGEKGYYDFSGVEYQEAKNITGVLIDGGIKPPYCSEFTEINDTTLHAMYLEFDFGNGVLSNDIFRRDAELPFPADDEGGEDLTGDGGEEDSE